MHRFIFVIGVAAVVAASADAAPQTPAPAGAPKTGAGGVARPSSASTARLLPGTRTNVFSTIRGSALSSTNGPLPSRVVRLRDVRFGRVVDTQLTDDAGMFAFITVDPGSYVVEVMGNEQTVLAASQIISVNAGDAVTTVVKLPFNVTPFAGSLRHAASAVAVTGAAIAAGVLATTVAGTETSPTRVF